jgi:SAM-dependent methyltransferase
MTAISDSVMYRRLKFFIDKGWLSPRDRTLIVCGGQFDQEVMEALGFADCVLSSLQADAALKHFVVQDAHHLGFADSSFDIVMVHAGLHHCSQPHLALCEMHRVARKCVAVFEAHDSWTIRLFARLGLALDYEICAVVDNQELVGGVNNSPIPNYVYRWTRREFEKTIRSLDPARIPSLYFATEFFFSASLADSYLKEHPLGKLLGKKLMSALARIAVWILNTLFRGQGNSFSALIRKDQACLQPWVEQTDRGITFRHGLGY